MAGLHPFNEELDGLQIGDTLGVELDEEAISTGVRGKKRKRTVHDVHRCGGRLDCPELLDILSGTKRKRKKAETAECSAKNKLNMEKLSKTKNKKGHSGEELKNECQLHGLVQSGSKKQMAKRLIAHYVEHI